MGFKDWLREKKRDRDKQRREKAQFSAEKALDFMNSVSNAVKTFEQTGVRKRTNLPIGKDINSVSAVAPSTARFSKLNELGKDNAKILKGFKELIGDMEVNVISFNSDMRTINHLRNELAEKNVSEEDIAKLESSYKLAETGRFYAEKNISLVKEVAKLIEKRFLEKNEKKVDEIQKELVEKFEKSRELARLVVEYRVSVTRAIISLRQKLNPELKNKKE